MAEGLEKLYYMIKATNTSKEEGHSAIPGKTKSCRESNGPRKKLSKVYQKIVELKKNEIDSKQQRIQEAVREKIRERARENICKTNEKFQGQTLYT